MILLQQNLLFVALGVLITLLILHTHKPIIKWFNNLYLLIRGYWLFIAIYIPTLIFAYIGLILYVPDLYKEFYLDMLGQVATISYAIFTGYYAFLQVAQSRLDKLSTLALEELRSSKYIRAIKLYEQCLRIKPDELDIVLNLMELYLIQKQFSDFDSLHERAIKLSVEASDIVKIHMLTATRYIVRQDIDMLKESIGRLVEYIKINAECLRSYAWEYADMKSSDTYKKLEPQTKIYYTNIEKYLSGKLKPEEKTSFESGDYLISTAS